METPSPLPLALPAGAGDRGAVHGEPVPPPEALQADADCLPARGQALRDVDLQTVQAMRLVALHLCGRIGVRDGQFSAAAAAVPQGVAKGERAVPLASPRASSADRDRRCPHCADRPRRCPSGCGK